MSSLAFEWSTSTRWTEIHPLLASSALSLLRRGQLCPSESTPAVPGSRSFSCGAGCLRPCSFLPPKSCCAWLCGLWAWTGIVGGWLVPPRMVGIIQGRENQAQASLTKLTSRTTQHKQCKPEAGSCLVPGSGSGWECVWLCVERVTE